jgi:2'-5' RNA ligase
MSDVLSPERLRLFVAIRLPERVKDEIERVREELRRGVRSGAIRWSAREQFHLTLKFLGGVEAQRAEPLADALRAACQGFAPFDLRAERVGFFPDERRPRVIWVGVQDAAAGLLPLQQAVEAATREFTEQGPEQKFMGHVTLGRIKSLQRSEAELLVGAVSSLGAGFFGEWRVEEIELVRSELSSQGASYTCLAAVRLRGNTATGQAQGA